VADQRFADDRWYFYETNATVQERFDGDIVCAA
jgi:hypothetical protein